MNRIILFFRARDPTRVKTRLAAEVGVEAALAIYRGTLADLWSIARDLEGVVPYSDREAVEPWPGLEDLAARARHQRGATLEQRMDNAFADAWEEGVERAVLVGSDIPGLNAADTARALESLKDRKAVIGPSADGGYYLIGFTHASYQSRFVLATAGNRAVTPFEQVIRGLQSGGVTWETLPELNDVDTAADVRAVYARGQGNHPAFDAAVRQFAAQVVPAEDSE